MMEIGLIAVHPEFQRQGLGTKLMDTVEGRSNAGKCTVGLVSCRTDVIPFFEKRGYVVSICVQCTHFSKNKKCILQSHTSYFQQTLTKSIHEVGKLYPDDLGEKVVTRDDLEWVILMKVRND